MSTNILSTVARLNGAALTTVAWPVVIAVLALLPWLGANPYWVRLVMLVAIMAMVTSGLNISFGLAGELALGQVAVFASGAYVTAFLAINGLDDLFVCLIASTAVALVVGLIAGGPGLRLGGFTLAMASFFLVILIPSIVDLFGEHLGGPDGLSGIPFPSVFGSSLDERGLYVAVVLVAGVWYIAFRNIVKSRQGRMMVALSESAVLASSCGANPFRMKLAAYAVGSIPAGLAGSLFVFLNAFISPTSFNFEMVIAFLAMSVLGGSHSVLGPIIGAFLLTYIPEQITVFDRYTLVAYGLMLVAVGVLFPRGVVGLFQTWWSKASRRQSNPAPREVGTGRVALPELAGETLYLQGVGQRFGGVVALDDVSFRAEPGRITALIGPNGSGKTTLLNGVSGFVHRGRSGRVVLGVDDLTADSSDSIRRRGVARTFQTPIIPSGLTIRECLTVGAYGDSRQNLWSSALRLPSFWRVHRREEEAADELLEALGLANRADEPASALSLGTRRVVELARSLMGHPRVVLLDEIASGLDQNEVDELIVLLGALRDAGATVVLVEHNFTMVRAVADHVVCLAQGRLLAEGSPDEIAAHPEVLEHYLGAGADISGTQLRVAGTSDEVRA